MRTVASRHNPAVRAFRALAHAPDGDGGRLLLDGVHLVGEARQAGLRFELAAVAASRIGADGEVGALALALEHEGVDVVSVPDRLFETMSPVRTPTGIAAIVLRDPQHEEQLLQPSDAFLLVVADVQDPGNVGALLRAAEAGGVTGAIVCANAASPFSWKAIRGSMGSALRLPLAAGLTPQRAFDLLQTAGARTIASVPRDGREPDEIGWSGRIGLFLGGEGPGLSAALAAACDDRVTIPMAPHVESLNVAVAGGILIYAARRQRRPSDRAVGAREPLTPAAGRHQS